MCKLPEAPKSLRYLVSPVSESMMLFGTTCVLCLTIGNASPALEPDGGKGNEIAVLYL